MITNEEIDGIVNQQRGTKEWDGRDCREKIGVQIATIIYSRITDLTKYFCVKRGELYFKPAMKVIVHKAYCHTQDILQPNNFYSHHIKNNLRGLVDKTKLIEHKEYLTVNEFILNCGFERYSVGSNPHKWSKAVSRNIENNENSRCVLAIWSKVFLLGIIVYEAKKNHYKAYLVEAKKNHYKAYLVESKLLTEITIGNALKIYNDFKNPVVYDWKEPFKGKIRGVYHEFTDCRLTCFDDKITNITFGRYSRNKLKPSGKYEDTFIEHKDKQHYSKVECAAVTEAI